MAATKFKIKKDDNVQMHRRQGRRQDAARCCACCRRSNRVLVEKLNMIKRHTKPRPAPRATGQQVIPGGVIEREAPLHISNVQLVCPACGKPSRVGFRINADGNKVRVCRACDKDVDG